MPNSPPPGFPLGLALCIGGNCAGTGRVVEELHLNALHVLQGLQIVFSFLH